MFKVLIRPSLALPTGSSLLHVQPHPFPSKKGLVHIPCSVFVMMTRCAQEICLPGHSKCHSEFDNQYTVFGKSQALLGT